MYQDRFSFNKSGTVKDLKKLYERLERTFSYDCNAEEDVSKYRTKSPLEFSQTKTGVCWDYAEYEAKELEKLGFKNTLGDLTNGTYSLYYHEIDDHKQCPTHTWVACMIDDTVYVVESAWYDNRGVHHYATESDMIKSYCHKLCNGFKAPIQHLLIKYRPSIKFGLNCIEYMNRMHDNGRVREREPIHETFGDIEFYHASDYLLKELKPVSPNLGNKLESPKWVVYLWKDKKRARLFAIQKAVRRMMNSGKWNTYKKPVYDVTSGKSFILQDEKNDIEKASIGLKSYVYTTRANLRSLGVGHASSIPEYTSTDSLPIIKTEIITITKEIFDASFEFVTAEDIYRYKTKVYPKYSRGILANIMNDQQDTLKKEMYIKRQMKSGNIHPGDKLADILNSYEESNDVFSFRNKKSMISKFQDMKIIYDKLSSKEKSYLGSKFIDSPNTVYRQVVYANDNLPIGFVELYDMHNYDKPEVIIEAAVSPEYRNQGIAINLINSAKRWLDNHHKYERIVYLIKNDNLPSIKLAKKTGFVYLTKERDHMVYVYNRANGDIDESLKFHF